MKKLIFTLTMSLPLLAAAQEKKFQIKGKLSASDNTTILLMYSGDKKFEIDSTKVRNGSFTFSGPFTDSRNASVVVKGEEGKDVNSRSFYLVEGTTTITGKTLTTATVKGGKVNLEFDEWAKANGSELRTKNAAAVAAFIAKYPASPVSLDLILQTEMKGDTNWDLFQKLSPAVKELARGLEYADQVSKFRALKPGMLAPDFAAKDPEGKLIKLSDFRGKYVFLDFWASWCKPCRAAHPYLQSVYEKFKDKGFTILGVALDYKKEAWLKAIAEDHVAWQQVSELNGFNSDIPKLYQVGAIPFGVLIDPQGKIIEHKGLDKTLGELLGN